MRAAATVALRALPRAALALPPAWRRRVVIVLVALVAFGSLYLFWFRDSSFASVQKVEVTGVSGPQAKLIRRALVDAGRSMTTLHVRTSALRDAVAAYPVVRGVTAQGQFPHVLHVQVELNLPVALLQTPSGKVPVTADGLVLRDVPFTRGLAVLTGAVASPAVRVTGGAAHAMLRVVAGAPEALRVRIRAVEIKAGLGLVAHIARGPDLIFGDATLMDAKWVAALRVLSSPSARGASYVDLRLPERPAAGGLPVTTVLPLAPAGSSVTPPAPTTTQPTTSQTTATTPATTPSAGTQTTTTTTTTTPATSPTQAPSATTGGGTKAGG
jgi:cell division protein FtsQ